MASAKRDDNGYPTIIGVSSTDGTTPVRALADPVTGYILMEIKAITGTTTTSPGYKPDDNAVPVLRGVTNNATAAVKPILSDPNNVGRILCDVLPS